MAEFNFKRLHGVFGFSVFTGIVLAIQISTGYDISEAGLATMIYNSFGSVLSPPPAYLDFIFLAVIITFDVGYTIYAILQIISYRWVGVFVSGTGFFGILLALFGMWGSSQFYLIFGFILLISGGLAASIKDNDG